jgi:hypothetical protein
VALRQVKLRRHRQREFLLAAKIANIIVDALWQREVRRRRSAYWGLSLLHTVCAAVGSAGVATASVVADVDAVRDAGAALVMMLGIVLAALRLDSRAYMKMRR